MTRSRLWAALLLVWASAAWADDAPKADPTPEARREMAAAHRKLAQCLESDRPIGACRTEMMALCPHMMGENGCPMMGHGGMHGHGMRPGGPQPEKQGP
jgi:hypothetical protein